MPLVNVLNKKILSLAFVLAGALLFFGYALTPYHKGATDAVVVRIEEGTSAWGIVDWARLGYEFHQGAHVYLQQEYAKTNLDLDTTKTVAYTAGILFYPRPHLELDLAWQKAKAPAVSGDFNDLAWILFHFYP